MRVWYNCPRTVRGLHLDRPICRTDYVFDNGYGMVTTQHDRNPLLYVLHGPLLWDSVDEEYFWIGEQIPKLPPRFDGHKQDYGYICPYSVILEIVDEIDSWAPATPLPDWPSAPGRIYLICNLGPFGGQVTARSKWHGRLGVHNFQHVQQIDGIPVGITAKQVMIARNNAGTEGKIKESLGPQIHWSLIAPFAGPKELGLRPVPVVFADLLGPDFTDETDPPEKERVP